MSNQPNLRVGAAHALERRSVIVALATAGVAGPVIFALVALVHSLLRPDHGLVADPVSALAAGPSGWIQNANFLLFGSLMIAYAIGLHLGVRQTRWGSVAVAFLVLSGVGLMWGWFFPATDATGAFDEDRLLHVPGFIMTFLGGGIGLIAMSRRMARDSRRRDLTTYALLSGAAMLVLIVGGAAWCDRRGHRYTHGSGCFSGCCWRCGCLARSSSRSDYFVWREWSRRHADRAGGRLVVAFRGLERDPPLDHGGSGLLRLIRLAPLSRPYSAECLDGAFSEVALPAHLCYLVYKSSVGEHGERREMHARMSIFEGPPDKIDEGLRQAREVVLPQAKQDEGFKGIIALTDHQSGKMVGITLWESAEAMRATEEEANRLREESAEAGGGTVAGVERYEVGLFEVPSAGPVSGVTDKVRGATDRLLGGGEEKRR